MSRRVAAVVFVALLASMVCLAAPASLTDEDIRAIVKKSDKFFAAVEEMEGTYKLPSGMLIQILNKGPSTGKTARKDTNCDVHYSGWLMNGQKFDSSYDRGQPSSFKPNQVVKAWTESLQLMKEGDKWRIFVPYYLGYGDKGSPPSIPEFSTLIFDIELIKVKGVGRPGTKADAALQKLIGTPVDDLIVTRGEKWRRIRV